MADTVLNDEIKDKLKGALYGAACGNSLGGSCVGLNHKEILGTIGISVSKDFFPGLTKSQFPNHKPGEVLADFILGQTLAEDLIENDGILKEESLKKRFKELLEDERFPCLGTGRSLPGCAQEICRRTTSHGQTNLKQPMFSGAARAFTLGCLPDKNGESSREEMAVMQAELTHNNRSVAAASAVICKSVAAFIQGVKLDTSEDVKNYVHDQLEFARGIDKRFADFWDDVAPDLDYSHQATDIPYSLVKR